MRCLFPVTHAVIYALTFVRTSWILVRIIISATECIIKLPSMAFTVYFARCISVLYGCTTRAFHKSRGVPRLSASQSASPT
ncbi:hypothetical protein C8Q70DRAFT_611499 [Cubamyces menziesii]|nr:hypothetical protein C8Q70DRAFT_611499 [Cubamyces menziesii]